MATLRDIKSRIKGVKSTQQITKAMKMVAAAKLRRAQESVINARPYARKISELISHLITEDDMVNNPFIIQREIKNIAYVIVTADRGLCGAFNNNILKESVRQLSNNDASIPGVTSHIYCIGKKSSDFYKRREYPVAGNVSGIFSTLKYDSSLTITRELIDKYLDNSFDKIIIIYNEFKSIIQQRIVTEQFLPIPIKLNNEEGIKQIDFIFEPGQREVFNYLLPKHLKAQIWRILLESNAAELGAKMTAMDNATTNAKELIRTLQLTYNKERQAAITKEILEIVSGANAQKEG
ncbi:MAG: ATP synthase F1 subunit gamma [Ignavibacteriaceae bacterium]|nr:ATP synthase F1 subunit gamma [Ignavibacteriaceae bacterium]